MTASTGDTRWNLPTAGLLIVPLIGLSMLGAVGLTERAVLAAAVAVLLGLVAASGRTGAAAPRVLWGMGALLVAQAAGLLSLPHDVLVTVAPGIAAARPEDVRWTLSLDGDRTGAALGDLAVLVAFAVAVAAVSPSRRRVGQALAWGTALWAVVGAGHAAAGAQTLFGLMPVRPGDGLFFAPLVNPNHHGTVLVAGLPFVIAEAWERLRARAPSGLLFAAVALYTLAYPVLAASMGLVAVIALQGLVALWLSDARRVTKLGVSTLGAAAAAGAMAWVLHAQPEWWALSGRPRFQQWGDTWALLRDHPLAGVGAGAYGAAYGPYRTVPSFAVFAHAHSDVLEWVAETGALGLVAVLVLMVVVPWSGRSRSLTWTLSAAAVVGHAFLDFPWHIPGVALFGVLVVGVWAWGDGEVRATRSTPVAALLLAVLGLAVLSRHAIDERQLHADLVRAGQGTCDDTVRALPLRWPLRPDLALAVWKTCDGSPAALLRALPQDGELLGEAAAWSLQHHPERDVLPLLERAVLRAPNDFRAWRVLAVVQDRRGDKLAAASAWANAFKHWPQEIADKGKPFDQAFATLPVGLWWLEALADAPAHWSIRLSRKLLSLDQPDTALLACQQAGRLRPAAHAWTGECPTAMWAMGQKDQAKAYLSDWRRARPDDFWAWLATAQILATDGVDPSDPVWSNAMVTAHRLRPDERRVLALLEQVRTACPPAGQANRPGVCTLADRLATAPLPAPH